MTPTERQAAHLLVLAARLSDLMAEQAVHQAELARRMHTDRQTVNRMLKGGNARAGTWVEAFAALGYDMVPLKRCA